MLRSSLVSAGAAILSLAAALGAPQSASAGFSTQQPVLRAQPRQRPVQSATPGTALVSYLHAIRARYVGPARFARMSIDIATPMRNAAGLKAYAQAASMPGSTYYRHFLTPEQIADAFATPASQYAQTMALLRAKGLTVRPWAQRSLITVTGTSATLGAALGTRFGVFQRPDRVTGRLSTFVSPTSDVTLPASIGTVSQLHLTTLRTRVTNTFIGGPAVPVSGSFSNARVNGATPAELSRAYDYDGAYAAGFTGKGVNLGIIGTGPITQGNSATNDDIIGYRKAFNVPGSSTVTIIPTSPTTVAGDEAPPPVTGPCSGGTFSGLPVGLPINDPTQGSSGAPTAGCDPEDVEAQLDTEQTSMLARDATIRFYLAYNGTDQGIDLTDDELAQAIADNQADILSLSFGECELLDAQPGLGGLTATTGGDATGLDPTMFQELAAEGTAVFVSSGDTGSAGCQREPGNEDNPDSSYPSSDPNVVAVGGTTTPLLPTGQLSGPITNWGSQTKSGGASGAGASSLFVMPSFQSAEPNVASVCAAAATTTLAAAANPPTSATLASYRCQPDVALDGDPFTGAAVIFNTGLSGGGEMEEPVGGTSQSAPDMAAMWALVLSACEVTPSCKGTNNVVDAPASPYQPAEPPAHSFRLGNPNFIWYKLAAANNSALYQQTFYDIVFGDDAVPPYAAQVVAGEAGGEGANVNSYTQVDPGALEAGPGYDSASGLGAPFARALIKYVVGV